MKNIISKWQLLAKIHPHLIGLFIFSFLSTSTVFAVETITPLANDAPYQSTFEEYSAMRKDTLTDWKSINQFSDKNNEHSRHKDQEMHNEIIKQDHETDLPDTFQGGSHVHP